jgi:hypothetical protein
MVTVADYAIRQNAEGEDFVVLILQGDLEMVQSQETGRFYATARRCSISSTFNEAVAAQMVGKQIPGNIQKVECEPYEYVIPESGEVVKLSHRWEYVPEQQTQPTSPKVHANQNVFSQNGQLADALI